MANDLNQCNFIGRLGKDPDCRFMPNGNAVTSFSIAVSEFYKDKSGQKVDKTEWINITAFNKLGEICSEFLRKGSKVYISGKFKTEKYTGNDGVEKYSTKIIANQMQMLDSRSDSNQGQQGAPQQAAQQAVNDGFEDDLDDLPF